MGIFSKVSEANAIESYMSGQNKMKVGGDQLAKAWDDAQDLVEDARKKRWDALVSLYGR